MNYKIRTFKNIDKTPILKIFNYYVEHSFAAYPDEKVGMNYLDSFFVSAEGYPFYVAENDEDEVVGFGLLHRFHRANAFDQTAEITYFIHPDYQRNGLGSAFFEKLVNDAKEKKISTIIASISSRNQTSLDFHKKNGFEECGRFKSVGKKFTESFDIIWMQKFL